MHKLSTLVFLGWFGHLGLAWSFPCNVIVSKDTCWNDYNVQVQVRDGHENNILFTIDVPKNTMEAKILKDCQAGKEIRFTATFSPPIWENTSNKSYMGKRYIAVPTTISHEKETWSIHLCFADDFQNVPLPPKSSGNCQCPRPVKTQE